MMQEPANSNTLIHTLGAFVRVNGIQTNMRTYSATPNVGHRSTPKCVRLFRTLFENSILVTALTIALFFGLIQESAATLQIPARTDVTTIYSSAWTGNSPTFSRHVDQMAKHYYYEPLQVSVSMAGTYTFTSNSPVNTYGYLYDGEFKPTVPSLKLISHDDDSNGQGQFKITATLQPGQKYILVATTFSPDTKGEFSILSSGPATIDMHSTIVSTKSVNGLVPSASRSTSTFNGYLSSGSPVFNRPNGNSGRYYYQAIQVTIYTSSTYTFTSSSSTDTYGCLYSGNFNPYYPSQNLITCDDDSGSGNQFLVSGYLQSSSTYILVVTSYSEGVTASFSIMASGLYSIYMNSITPQGSTVQPVQSTTYTGYLSHDNPSFTRPSGSSGPSYYYQAFRVEAPANSQYTFTSTSSLDTYGCLYSDPFNPRTPSVNRITCDDDSNGNSQFKIDASLQYSNTYILVVTTYSSRTTGSFTITATGPGRVSLTSTTPTESESSDLPKILGITFGCLALFVIILAIIIYKVKSSKKPNQPPIASRNNQTVRPQNVPMSNVYGNAPRPNGGNAPYTISMYGQAVTYGEAPPPSYDTYVSSLKPPQ